MYQRKPEGFQTLMGRLSPRGEIFVLLIHPNKTSAVLHVCWEKDNVPGDELRHLFVSWTYQWQPNTTLGRCHICSPQQPHTDTNPTPCHSKLPHKKGFRPVPHLLCIQDISTLRAGTDPWISLGKVSALHLPMPQHHSVQPRLNHTVLFIDQC